MKWKTALTTCGMFSIIICSSNALGGPLARKNAPVVSRSDRGAGGAIRLCHLPDASDPSDASDCGPNAFCRVPIGSCNDPDAQGICMPIPSDCPAPTDVASDYPVCGCDGATYADRCEAYLAGTNIDHVGPCRDYCNDNTSCRDNQFCEFPVGTCGHVNAGGKCSPKPDACPENYTPVCGCDGITYSNHCSASAAGVSVKHEGPCVDRCDPNDATACSPDEFCKQPPGQCSHNDGLGKCTPIPQSCPDIWEPVCGCDGITYGNACETDMAGVSVLHRGPCEPICRPTPNGFGCTPNACSAIPEERCLGTLLHLDINTGAVTTQACDCLDFNACHVEFGNATPFPVGHCPAGQSCEIVGRDTNNDGTDDTFAAACVPKPSPGVCCLDIDDGPVSYDTCRGADFYTCEENGGDFHGVSSTCSDVQACCLNSVGSSFCIELNPYCCLDSGGTPQGHSSTCSAVNTCPQICGGFLGLHCDDPDQFCKTAPGQCCCDFTGICTDIPDACPSVRNPVCGCDGVTYSNECEAYHNGVQIDHRGPCEQ